MFKLRIVAPNGKIQDLQLEENPVTLGRGNDCDVVLKSRSVYRHHLRAWAKGSSVLIEDLTEGQGILLDGQPVEEDVIELEPGCKLDVGVYQLSLTGKDEQDTAARSSGGTDRDIPEITAKHTLPQGHKKPERRPRLIGLRGSLKGKEFSLEPGETEVGRAETNHIILDYQSISRLHAKLTREGEQCSFQDMRSSNGTFLNKKKNAQGHLRHGDSLRFGAIEFVFALEDFDLAKYHAKKKRKVMLVSLVATLAAIAAVLVVFLGLLQPPKPKPVPTAEPVKPAVPEIPSEIRADKHLKQAETFRREENWEAAKSELAKALEIHPLCKPCRTLDALISAELENAERYKQGLVEHDLKHWAEARQHFKAITSTSAYFVKARNKLAEAEDKLSKYYKLAFKDADKEKDFIKAHTIAVEYMRMNPCDKPVYQAWVKKFEKRLRQKRSEFTPYLYDCESVKQIGPLEPEELIRKIYPAPKIGNAVFSYYEGKIDKAMSDLSKLSDSGDKAVKAQAKDLLSKLTRLKDKHMEGGTQLMRGEEEGQATLLVAMRLDAEIIPTGLTSKYRQDMGVQLGSKLYKQGFLRFKKNDYFKAFAIWDECLRLHPDDRNCEGGMKNLEQVADDVLKMAESQASRGDKKQALSILRDMQRIVRPGTTRFKQAQYLIDKLSK